MTAGRTYVLRNTSRRQFSLSPSGLWTLPYFGVIMRSNQRDPCSGDRCSCSWSETGGGGGKPFSFPASQLPKNPDELAEKIAEIVEERRLGGRNAKAEMEVIRPTSLLLPGEKTPVTRGNSEGWHEASGSGRTDSRWPLYWKDYPWEICRIWRILERK